MTDPPNTDRTRLGPLQRHRTCQREQVARQQEGRQRNWASTTPPTTTTNRPHNQPQRWVEKVGRSITNSERPHLDEHAYPKKITVTDEQLAAVNLTGHDFHPEWNYTISPTPTTTNRTH